MIITINALDLIGLAILGVAAVGLVVLFLADRIAYAIRKRQQRKMEEDYTE